MLRIYRLFGFEVFSIEQIETDWYETETDEPEPDVDDLDAAFETVIADNKPQPGGKKLSEPIITEHGVAYHCRLCSETLLEGLDARISPADEIELEVNHNCDGDIDDGPALVGANPDQ